MMPASEKNANLAELYLVQNFPTEDFLSGGRVGSYYVILLRGKASFVVDFTKYTVSGHHLLFLSPFQYLQWIDSQEDTPLSLAFHGDFYCIEYHKEEVACNGLLFNNIYQKPYVALSENLFKEIQEIIGKIQQISPENDFDISIIKTYLQLILALSSKEKQTQISTQIIKNQNDISGFQDLLEAHFLHSRQVNFYAEKYHLSVNAFGKQVKKFFGKTPSELIRERLALEAKKLLHLSHKSIKQIAGLLQFEDEFYFSRYFKKEVGVSPKEFRKRVGISVAAAK